MPKVDFVYDPACPHVEEARAHLLRAFARAGVSARWEEHRIGDADASAHVRGYGSPSILVDGVDVTGHSPLAGACCRVYASGGAPDVELIAAALTRSEAQRVPASLSAASGSAPPRRPWKPAVAALPGLGVALLPKVVCPLCWPAYAGLLSAAGLTFLMEDRWLFPISVALLAVALVALGWRADARRGYGPLLLGALAAVAIVAGKFAIASTSAVYTGVTILVVACVWNLWPRRAAPPNCAACRPS